MKRRRKQDTRTRFMRRIAEHAETGCWLWTGCTRWGYGATHVGVVGDGLKTVRAHRLSWELHRGPIPPNALVLHKCDVRACCNPEHLYLGDKRDNARDLWERGKPYVPPAVRGSASPRAKLNERQVAEIKQALRSGASQTALGRKYGVSNVTVSAIKACRIWQHVA